MWQSVAVKRAVGRAKRERNAAGVDGYPSSAPLLGGVRRSSATTKVGSTTSVPVPGIGYVSIEKASFNRDRSRVSKYDVQLALGTIFLNSSNVASPYVGELDIRESHRGRSNVSKSATLAVTILPSYRH